MHLYKVFAVCCIVGEGVIASTPGRGPAVIGAGVIAIGLVGDGVIARTPGRGIESVRVGAGGGLLAVDGVNWGMVNGDG